MFLQSLLFGSMVLHISQAVLCHKCGNVPQGSTSPAPGTGCVLAGAPGGQKLSSCPGKCGVTFLNMKPHRKGCLERSVDLVNEGFKEENPGSGKWCKREKSVEHCICNFDGCNDNVNPSDHRSTAAAKFSTLTAIFITLISTLLIWKVIMCPFSWTFIAKALIYFSLASFICKPVLEIYQTQMTCSFIMIKDWSWYMQEKNI